MLLCGGFYKDINSIPIILIQDISENDMRLKRQFCRWALRMIREDPTFSNMFFSVTKPHFITMDNPTGITVIIGPHTILTGLNVLIINIVEV